MFLENEWPRVHLQNQGERRGVGPNGQWIQQVGGMRVQAKGVGPPQGGGVWAHPLHASVPTEARLPPAKAVATSFSLSRSQQTATWHTCASLVLGAES